jgi:hypothetical protein
LPGAVAGEVPEGVFVVDVVVEVVVVEGELVGRDVVEGEVVWGGVVDALEVDPVCSAGVVVVAGVGVEVVLVPLPDEDGVAGPLEDVELAAHPATSRARTMG